MKTRLTLHGDGQVVVVFEAESEAEKRVLACMDCGEQPKLQITWDGHHSYQRAERAALTFFSRETSEGG